MAFPRLILAVLISSIVIGVAADSILNIGVVTLRYIIQNTIASIEKVLANPAAALGCAGDQVKTIVEGLTKLSADLAGQLARLSVITAPSVAQAVMSDISNFQANLVSNTTCLSVSFADAANFFEGQIGSLVGDLNSIAQIIG